VGCAEPCCWQELAVSGRDPVPHNTLPACSPCCSSMQAWLDHNNALVGTKCNKLRVVHLPTRTWHEVGYPEQPVHRQGPDLLAQANGSHCGQHDMAVSPSGTFLVSGATAAEDLLLWRLQDSSSLDSSASSSGRQVMQPLQTFMGHADWVFGLDWISDRHWVSAGRDRTIKLWQVPDTAASEAAYTADPGSALLSVSYHQVCGRSRQDRQRPCWSMHAWLAAQHAHSRLACRARAAGCAGGTRHRAGCL
jgi:hypothetical protein